MSKLACSRPLRRWLSFCKMLPSLFFFVVLISRNKFLIFVFLWEANFSGAPIRDATRWWGSEFQREIGSSSRFEELDTDIRTCFPVQVVVFGSLKVSSWTQVDSKSNFAKVLKSLCALIYLIELVKESFSDLIYNPRIDIFHSLTACS